MSTLRRIVLAVSASAGVVGAIFASKKDQVILWASPKHRGEKDHHVDSSWSEDEKRKLGIKWDHNWDKMAPAAAAVEGKDVGGDSEGQVETKPTATRTLILVRHGQYVWDPHDPNKRILTELGRKQAAVTGQRLKELGITFSAIHYSTMPRATETSQIIQKIINDVPASSCDLMREGAPIRPEPMNSKWRPENYEFFRDGPRIEAAFRKYFHRASASQTENTVELLVCHANVIRYFVCRALQLPPEAWLRISLAHASLTVVVCRPNGTVSLKTLGSSEHMPPKMVTYS